MPGQVAWEPLLNPGHAESGIKKERDLLQKRLLWDAWHYMAAEELVDVAEIKEQLLETPKQRVLLEQLNQARKIRTTNIKQRRQRRETRRQRMIELELPAESVEQDDDEEDPGLGSGGEGSEDNEEGPMPPPPPPRRYGLSGVPGGPRASYPPRRSAYRGSFNAETSDDDVVETVRTGSHAVASRSRGPASVRASGSKRRRNEGSRTHSSQRHSQVSNMFASSSPQLPDDADDDDRHEGPLVPGVNGDFDDEEGAVAEAKRQSLSVVPEERRNPWTFETGLDYDGSLATAIQNSMAQGSPSRQSRPL